jgi:hypothetical protein
MGLSRVGFNPAGIYERKKPDVHSLMFGAEMTTEDLMHDTCPRCGSNKIIPDVPIVDCYDNVSHSEVKIHGAPQAWVYKDTASGKLSVWICGECGHAELQVSNFRKLYEKYEKSRQPQTSPAASKEDGSPGPQFS